MSMNTTTQIPAACCAPGSPLLSTEERDDLAARFKALSDPTRLAIVNRLAGSDEVCVCAFVAELGLSQPTVSHHLRILREAGLVEARRNGTWGYYRLVPETVAALAGALGNA
jgi:ArsR family transcriptional regulator, arsenate/arsenite/antimonite-responsive transcriptional repressor